MNWVDYEKQKPEEAGYYLCEIWENSVNQYGASTEYKVCYYSKDNEKMAHYPVIDYHNGNLVEFHKVLWWAEISGPPINPDHHVLPPLKQETIPVKDDEAK